MSTVSLIISIFLLVSSIVAAILSVKKFKSVKPIYILLAGTFLAIFSLMLFVDHKPHVHGGSTTFFLSLFHTIQVMFLGYDFEFLQTAFSELTPFAHFFYTYCSVLFFLAPICTFGFVLSFFESVTNYAKYLFKKNADIYVLSKLSEESLVLARSIREKFPKALIMFMDVHTDAPDISFDHLAEVKKIKAIFFKKEMADLHLRFHSAKSKITFFAIHKDESVNLDTALCIISAYNSRQNCELYVFSTSDEGQLLLDSADNGLMKVRRINVNRALAYSTIYQNLITENYTERDGKKIISTLIVGMSGYGTELTKALLWCGQLPGYELELNIIDKNEDTESKFEAICPEIMLLNGNTEFGEAIYRIQFYNGIDIHTAKFNKTIAGLKNTSAVYVSLGNDELNIETAIHLRILFERMGLYPMIRTIVHSGVKYDMLKKGNLVNHQGKSYDIEIIGNVQERYAYDTIINEELEELALECHLRWANNPEERENAIRQFHAFEYFRNSSIATAIHEKYRRIAHLPVDVAATAEHMRWNAYMRTEGFVYSGSTDSSSRNDRAKMHHNLHHDNLLSTSGDSDGRGDRGKDMRMVEGTSSKE